MMSNITFMVAITFTLIYFAYGTAYKGRTNAIGVSLIKSAEGFSAKFYNDTSGVKKIGYGHSCALATDKCTRIASPIDEATALQILLQDLRTAETCVTTNVKYPKLNEAQFSALSSFTQSVGCSSFRSSNLLKLLNKGDVKGASREFSKWATIGVTPVRNLRRRREAEKNLFCSKGGC